MGVLQHAQGFQALCNQISSDRKSKHTIVTAINHISYTAGQTTVHGAHRFRVCVSKNHSGQR